MSDIASENIKTRCPACNKKLAFPPAAVGRKAKCPACAHVFRVAADSPPKPAPPPAAAEESEGAGSLFDAFAAMEQSAEGVQMSEEEAARARAAGQAAFATQSAALAGGPREEAAPVQQLGARADKARDRTDPDGSFFGRDGAGLALVRGVIFSIIGALVVDAAWFGIAKAMAGYSPGFMPLLVGAGAALGMTLGIRSETKVGGILAVVITWVGIGVGEVLVVMWILIPQAIAEAKVEEDSIKYQRHVVYENEIAKAYEKANVDYDKMTPGLRKDIENQGKRIYGAYTDDQIRVEYKKIQAASGPPPAPKPVATAMELLKLHCFSYLSLLSSIGALVIAFFVGSGILSLGIE